MRLRKLLLGSAAAMFVVGASTGAAKAADPMNGLVSNIAAALAACANGAGAQYNAWCFVLSGSSAFSTEVGYEITIDPNNPFANTVDPVGGTFPWAGFTLTNKLALTATRDFGDDKTITVKIPIVGSGTTSLAISRAGGATWTFTGSSITVAIPTNFADFTVAVSEGDAHPFYPDLDLTTDMDFGSFGLKLHGGIGFTDENINGVAIAPFFEPEADVTLSYDGESVDVTLGGHYQRVVNAAFVAQNTFGIDGEVKVAFGNVTANAGAAFGWGNDFSGNYAYTNILPGDRIVSVWGGASFAWNDMHTTSVNVKFTRNLAFLPSDWLDVTAKHTWDLGDDVKVNFGATYERDGVGNQAVRATAGITVGIN